MIVVTGAAGFIASNVVKALNDYGRQDLILVDDFSKSAKRRNYEDKFFHCLVHRDAFLEQFKENHESRGGNLVTDAAHALQVATS